MKKEGESSSESRHIIVTEVPPGFLKRRNIRTHFSRFGTITRLSIQNTFCVITFESVEHARDAVEHGGWWNDMPMKIDFTATHDPFATDDALINEELNWFAEVPDYGEKKKPHSSKAKGDSSHSHHRSKALTRLHFPDDDNSKSSEENRFKFRKSDDEKYTSRKSEKRQSASSRFLDDIKSKFKADENKRLKLFDGGKREHKSVDKEEAIVDKSKENKSKINLDRGKELFGGIRVNRSPLRFAGEDKDLLKGSGEERKSSGKSRSPAKLLSTSHEPSVDSTTKPILPSQLKSSTENSGQFTFISAFSENLGKSKAVFDETASLGTKSDSDKFDNKVGTAIEAVTDYSTQSDAPVGGAFGGTPQEFGSSSQAFGIFSQAFGGPSEAFGSSSKGFTSSTPAFGGTSQVVGNTFQPFGSSSLVFGSFAQVSASTTQASSGVPQALEVNTQVFGSSSQTSRGMQSFESASQEISNAGSAKSLEDNKISENIRMTLKPGDESKSVVKTSDAPLYRKVANSLQEKLNLLEERDRLMRVKMDKSSRIESAIQGTCPDMCPEKERVLRELMNIIAPYESLPDGKMDHSKAVKEYARSSADQEEPLPHDLRPEPVLTMTMTYLINCIISRIDEVGEENQSSWYDFCWGRLRAIRKDIIQQQLCDTNTVTILEQCARFHIACYDRLWGTDKSHFDDKINTETLVNCLQSLIHMYEDLRREGISCPNEAEFISYLILLKINSGFLMSEYQQYSKSLKESSLVKEAVKIHLAYNNNMYSTFFKLVKQTSYLNACLMQRFFQHIRIMALNTTIRAHCVPNKLTNISVKFLMETLKLDLFEDCILFCESVGLVYNDDDETFRVSRSDFQLTENSYKIETPSSLVFNKRIGISEAVVGNTKSLPIYLNHTVHNSFNEEGFLNESALDASDQEDKMLRDSIDRKLLLSRLEKTFAHKLQTDYVIGDSRTSVETPAKPIASESPARLSEDDEVEMQDIGEEMEAEDDSFGEDSATSPSSSFSEQDVHSPEKTPSPSPEPLTSSFSFSSTAPSHTPLPSSGFFVPSLQSSPVFVTSPHIPTPPRNNNVFFSTSKAHESHSPTNTLKLLSPVEKTEPTFNSNFSSNPSPPEKPSSPNEQEYTIPEHTALPFKSISKKTYCDGMDIIRQKMRENMERILAQKYVKIWKEKVFVTKESNECETMTLYNMSLKEHVMLWGKPPLNSPLNLPRRLHARKKSNLMVQMILNTDIINKLGMNVNKAGNTVVNALGECSVRKAEEWGNIARTKPVFSKLVFALPEPPPQPSTFSTKFRAWCKAAFPPYQVKISQSGVPVFSTVTVVEGFDRLQQSSNLTGLIVIRARHWETTRETENRISKILTYKNCPIPLAVLHLGSDIDPVNVSSFTGITHFEECLWNSSQTMTRVLKTLAHNVYLLNLNVKPFCSLLEEMSEKLFDFLQQESYLDERLGDALSRPNNIIYIYNKLLHKIQEEIVYCKVQNYFGTACEFKEHLSNSNICFNFPDNYTDLNYEKAFSFRCNGCKLKPFKQEFEDSKELISFLRDYCDETGCKHVLSKLVRSLNLPEEESDVRLEKHLRSVRWLPFIETILKEIFTSPYLNFRVLYREDSIQNIFLTRFWFDSIYAVGTNH